MCKKVYVDVAKQEMIMRNIKTSLRMKRKAQKRRRKREKEKTRAPTTVGELVLESLK